MDGYQPPITDILLTLCQFYVERDDPPEPPHPIVEKILSQVTPRDLSELMILESLRKTLLNVREEATLHILDLSKDHIKDVPDLMSMMILIQMMEKDEENKDEDVEASAPVEVEMGGPKMRALYKKACEEGTTEVYYIRLILVGKHRNGKSSLKNSLLRLEFNKDEKITDGIVITPCVMTGKDEWKVIKGSEDNEFAHAVAMKMKNELKKEKEEEEATVPESTDGEDGSARSRKDPVTKRKEDSEFAVATGMKKLKKEKEEEEATVPKSTDGEDGSAPPHMDHVTQEAELGTSSHQDPAREQGAEGSAGTQPWPEEDRFKHVTRIVSGKEDLSDLIGSKEHPAMTIWDYAGHDVYYSSHHIFYTHYAIYIATLNLTKPLETPLEPWPGSCKEAFQLKTEGDVLDYHLESIQAHTRPSNCTLLHDDQEFDNQPSVIVVGTHKDQVTQEQIDDFISKLDDHFSGKAIDKHVYDKCFVIDNTKRDPEDPELSNVRDAILKIAQEQNHMGKRIPISWLELKSKLMEMEKQGKKYCSLQEAIDAANTTEENAVTILRFFHLCGDFLFFNIPELRNFVVLNPQWFLNVLRTIITIPNFRDREVKEDWRMLEKTGILEDNLVEHVWKKRQVEFKCDLIPHKDKLLKMMEQYDLVLQCSPDSKDETGANTSSSMATTYFVPSLLTEAKDKKKLHPKGTRCSKPIFAVFDDKFFPVNVYHRLVIASMRRYNRRKPEAHACCARYITSNPKQTFVITKERHYLRVKLLSSEKEESTCFSHGPDVRKGLDEDLREIIDKWIPGIRYKWCLQCCCDSHKEEESDDGSFITITNVEEWFVDEVAICETYPPGTTSIQDIGLAHWFQRPWVHASESNRLLHPSDPTTSDDRLESTLDPAGQGAAVEELKTMDQSTRRALLDLQDQLTDILRANFPNLNFVPDKNKEADERRIELNRRTLHKILLSSCFNYSLESGIHDLIQDRKQSVCRINFPGGFGTGFLLSKGKVITCYHVYRMMYRARFSEHEASKYTATFFVREGVDREIEYKVPFEDPGIMLKCYGKDLDYAILQLALEDEMERYLDKLPLLAHFISESEDERKMVVLVGHPGGGNKVIDHCRIAGENKRDVISFHKIEEDARKPLYETSVMFEGSSGSPGFDTFGNVMLMHTTGLKDGNGQSVFERGVRLSAIRDHARHFLVHEKKAPLLFSEIFQVTG